MRKLIILLCTVFITRLHAVPSDERLNEIIDETNKRYSKYPCESEDLSVAIESLLDIWEEYENKVLNDNDSFKSFLNIVLTKSYQKYSCKFNTTYVFKIALLDCFINKAQALFNDSNTPFEIKIDIAYKAFLVYFVAKHHARSVVDNLKYFDTVIRMLKETYLQDSTSLKPNERCKMDKEVVAHMLNIYALMKKFAPLAVGDFKNYLSNNHIINLKHL